MLSSAVRDSRGVSKAVLQGVVPQAVSHSHCRTNLPLLCPLSWPLPSQPLTPPGCSSSPLTPTQQRGSTARAGDSRTTLPRTLLAFTGPTCPLGKAAKCKAALLTGAVDEQPRNMGLLHICLACHLQSSAINRKQTDLVKERHNLESTP